MKVFTFDKAAMAQKAGRWLHNKLNSRGVVANSVQIAFGLAFGMLWAADEAHATGLKDYAQTTFGNFDFSQTFTPIAAAVGGAGTLGSGYKLWQGMHDGGQIGDNLKPITALLPSAALLGYSAFKTAVSQTGGGS